ncbi:hypothetical protein H2198_007346 [Neophaeococcomyces mojaviensis]|uniref:Uncharacterized protein n=1 Tax=Neophaeococcomyces mojaviensis TaxID=3383035 RepID=A0ACC3A0D3_9EURO|nr:hypothetical protein H2198_007346 [Knufia sp. JES_112]
MAPTLICVRHAQGFHNLGPEFHSLRDPKLTELGEQQCAILRDSKIVDHSKISLITASPLTRTIHTACLSFKPAFENGKCKARIVAIPDTQETSDFPCDTGSDLDVLRKRCEEMKWPVDLSMLTEDWNVKSLNSRYSPASDKIKIRAQAARQQLRQLMRELVAAGDKDAQVVLVTHGGYLHYFTDDWEDSNKYFGTGWLNTEARSYTYKDGVESDSDDASLVETAECRIRRGKSANTVDKSQQEQLFHTSHQGWDDQGLGNALKIKSEA